MGFSDFVQLYILFPSFVLFATNLRFLLGTVPSHHNHLSLITLESILYISDLTISEKYE
ncbi:MAG: hypothetical protein Q8S84_03720 [bacterium]|nr:hypothetical protein [bacterium]